MLLPANTKLQLSGRAAQQHFDVNNKEQEAKSQTGDYLVREAFSRRWQSSGDNLPLPPRLQLRWADHSYTPNTANERLRVPSMQHHDDPGTFMFSSFESHQRGAKNTDVVKTMSVPLFGSTVALLYAASSSSS